MEFKAGNEWTMTYPADTDGQLPDGGIILNDLKHQGHSFAKDMRVLGFWVEFEKFKNDQSLGTEEQYFPLKHETFVIEKAEEFPWWINVFGLGFEFIQGKAPRVTDSKSLTIQNNILQEIKQFKKFAYIGGLRSAYTLQDNFSQPNCDYKNVRITQTYLFSKYGSKPSHEPLGVLNAARFFPLIKYSFIENDMLDTESEERTEVRSIRCDYRFELSLDTQLSSELELIENISLEEKQRILNDRPQQAGIFADEEIPDLLKKGQLVTAATFRAAEKPLIFEVVGKGLENGSPLTDNKTKIAWDNIHWWNFRGTGQDLISAPGAFYAAHFHWRWGKIPSQTVFGEQFVGANTIDIQALLPSISTIFSQAFGPALVDPNCWIQDISFGVVKANRFKIQNKISHDFFKHFILSGKNEEIQSGASLTLFYSIVVKNKAVLGAIVSEPLFPQLYRLFPPLFPDPNNTVVAEAKPVSSNLNGTINIHGIFFAHEPEPLFWSNKFAYTLSGTLSEEYFPTTEDEIRTKWVTSNAWVRYAESI